MIRGPLKFGLFSLLMLTFIVHHTIIKLFLRDRGALYRYYLRSITLTSVCGLKILNIHPTFEGEMNSDEASLNVSNHLSYVDVLVLFSKFPSLFITSAEMRDVFLLGHITKLAGCFHVERRKKFLSKELVERELQAMKKELDNGFSLFLFPEGTSSNGESVLPFKSHFFQTAIASNAPVRLFSINYNSPLAHWYGDMTFPDHLFKLCCQKSLSVKVKVLETIATHSSMDRFEFSRTCHEKIRMSYEQA